MAPTTVLGLASHVPRRRSTTASEDRIFCGKTNSQEAVGNLLDRAWMLQSRIYYYMRLPDYTYRVEMVCKQMETRMPKNTGILGPISTKLQSMPYHAMELQWINS